MAQNKTKTLVWIDLEMTGLDPKVDRILEIATIVTDNELNIIKEGPALVIHADDVILDQMHPQVKEMHNRHGLTEKVRQSSISIEDAQAQTMAFLKEYAEPNSPLCGNSVWADRAFLINEMPQITDYLHYRIIDVSTIKELVLRWYAEDPQAEYTKKETHRALADIRESIDELKHYRNYFFKK